MGFRQARVAVDMAMVINANTAVSNVIPTDSKCPWHVANPVQYSQQKWTPDAVLLPSSFPYEEKLGTQPLERSHTYSVQDSRQCCEGSTYLPHGPSFGQGVFFKF